MKQRLTKYKHADSKGRQTRLFAVFILVVVCFYLASTTLDAMIRFLDAYEENMESWRLWALAMALGIQTFQFIGVLFITLFFKKVTRFFARILNSHFGMTALKKNEQ